MTVNPVFFVLYWAQVVGMAILARTYVPAAARWNLLVVSAAVFACEMVAMFVVLLLKAVLG